VAAYPDTLTELFLFNSIRGAFPEFLTSSLPSLLFVMYMSAFSYAVSAHVSRALNHILLWLVLGSISEGLQGFAWMPGTFDVLDMIGLFLGGLLAIQILPRTNEVSINQKDRTRKTTLEYGRYTKPLKTLAGIFSVSLFYISVAGSYCDMDDEGHCKSSYIKVEPIFLAVDTIRQPIAIEYGDTQRLESTGKIYVYDKYLFIVDEYEGIHVFDNENAAEPVRIAYIPIIGVTDVSINSGYLYSNSYMDLIAIKLSDVLANSLTESSIIRHHDYFERVSYTDIIRLPYIAKERFHARLRSDDEIVIGFVTDSGERTVNGKLDISSVGILEE
jgi:hypothetical protein